MTKVRYRRESTQRDQELTRLADDATRLRREMQSMVRRRRRSDVRPAAAPSQPDVSKKTR